MTRLTLWELAQALGVEEPAALDAQGFRLAREDSLDSDALFCALIKQEGLGACQEKLVRWAHDLYQTPVTHHDHIT